MTDNDFIAAILKETTEYYYTYKMQMPKEEKRLNKKYYEELE